MVDTLTKEKRSEVMSKIQGGRNNKMEMAVHNWLKGNRIRHRMWPRVDGHPDVHLTDTDTYLFLDGCFWHICPQHYRRPKSRQGFWIPHIEESNERREKKRKNLPYRWVRIWEHDVKNGRFKDVIRKCLNGNKKS